MTDRQLPVFAHRPPETDEIPLVVSVPHTGVFMPQEMLVRLANDTMRTQPMTDWHLHKLYDFVPELGADLLCATYARFVVDLNRPPTPRALYPGRFETGLVALETFTGEPIWSQPPDEQEIAQRRELYHQPYHDKLNALIQDKLKKFGQVWLIDAHSIASHPTRMHDKLDKHIYLGNRDGLSCEDGWYEFMVGQFESRGMSVSRNYPYKGGYITDHYGSNAAVQAVQIEMNQELYMDQDDPASGPTHPNFAATQDKLKDLFAEMVGKIREIVPSK